MVRLASVALLAVTAGAALAAPSPAPTPAPNAEAVLYERGLLDWIGLGDDNDTSTSSAEEQQTPEQKMDIQAAGNLAQISTAAKETAANNSQCASACSATTALFDTCYTNGTGVVCACEDKQIKSLSSCTSCLGGDYPEKVNNWTSFCERHNYTSSGKGNGASALPIPSSLVAQGGLAAALVAGGLALLF